MPRVLGRLVFSASSSGFGRVDEDNRGEKRGRNCLTTIQEKTFKMLKKCGPGALLQINRHLDDFHLLIRVAAQAAHVLQVLHSSCAAIRRRLRDTRFGKIDLRFALAPEVRLVGLCRVCSLRVQIGQLDRFAAQ